MRGKRREEKREETNTGDKRRERAGRPLMGEMGKGEKDERED